MAPTGLFHHVGTFLLFAAAVLLLVTTISAPVVNSISMLRVSTAGQGGDISFGTFGYCTLNSGRLSTAGDSCSSRTIGYSPVEIMEAVDSADYGSAARNTADGLTRVQILHPIACALAFIAFAFALGAGICGGLFASAMAAIAWIVTLVVTVTDFVAWGIVKDHVNGDNSGSSASFGVAMWTCLAAMILLFFAMFIVLFSCCSARRRRRNTVVTSKHDHGYANGPTTRTYKRHFWQRRNRY